MRTVNRPKLVVVGVLALGAVLAVAGSGAPAASALGAAKTPTLYAYVTSAPGTTPISTSTEKAGTPLAGAGGAYCFTPNGKELLALDGAASDIEIISTATNKVLGSIPEPNDPTTLVMLANGKAAYAVNELAGTVTPLNIAKRTAGTPITVGSNPHAAVATPDSKKVFVADEHSAAISVISTTTNKVIKTINDGAGNFPVALAITPNAKTVFVVNDASSPSTDGTVTPVTVTTDKLGTPITVGREPFAAAITPNGKTLFVTNEFGQSVSAITVATGKIARTVDVGDGADNVGPQALIITPNGKSVYVQMENFDATKIWPITVKTLTAGSGITVGTRPTALAVTPNSKTVYVANYTDGTVSSVSTSTNTAGTPISVGSDPSLLAVMPAPFLITTSSLPHGKVHKHYRAALKLSGGVGPFAWTRTKGKLPAGLTLSKAGVISGKPKKAKTSSFTVKVTEVTGYAIEKTFRIKIT